MATAAAAAQTSGLLNLEKELVCFICTEVLYQPLTLIDCLHTFCGSCLKEWFSHQYRKASHSPSPPAHPYTCPTCRAVVKDVQHNAMINTLLEMFLAANPEKHRSAEEKAEMAKIYKPGDNMLLKVESRRRERRRPQEEEAAGRTRRTAADTRDRTRREGEDSTQSNDRLAPRSQNQRSRSRSRDQDGSRDRRLQERQDRQQRREMREHLEAAEARIRDEPAAAQSLLPPQSSPRHPDAVEARSRASNLAHQASIRSLVSASDSGTGTGDSLTEAQLMQEILSEGLLDGINVDELTEAEQDQLSEVIAERYRQLHPHRLGRAGSSTDAVVDDEAANSAARETTQLEEADRPRHASRSGPPRVNASSRSTSNTSGQGTEPRLPMIQTDVNLSPPSQERARRRASDQTGRGEAQRSHRSAQRDPPANTASRSATDLSDRPQTAATAAEGLHRLSDNRRSQTEPRQGPTASELWSRGGVVTNRNRPSQSDSTTQPPPLVQNATLATASAVKTQTEPPPAPQTIVKAAKDNLTNVTTSFEEPEISCYRCQRKGIQYEVYKHCSSCDVDLCLQCYRGGRGCNHWFGFGYAALSKFDASHPRNRGSVQMELPHLLVGRHYRRPPAESVQSKDADTGRMTSSDPASRLQQGHFCDRCGTFANSCFWTCDYCNEGEWGFCNSCVATHHCCTHSLLPMAHKDFAPGSPYQLQPVDPFAVLHMHPTSGNSAPSSATSAADHSFGPQADYVQLSITTHCDICTQPIPPSQTRYHCPSHPTPTPQQPKSMGDYDICTSCYHNLVKIGRVPRNDGPAGWRKCPNGHRMIVTNFEADSDVGQRRIVVSDLVGGVKMTEEHIRQWNENLRRTNEKDQGGLGAGGQAPLHRGRWTWYDPAEGDSGTASSSVGTGSEVGGLQHKRTKSRQATFIARTTSSSHDTNTNMNSNTNTNSSAASDSPSSAQPPAYTPSPNPKFPPNGGGGKTCLALWSYYPEEGEDGKGELMFPKGADVVEVEAINEDWDEGVYAGVVGFVPRVYVTEVLR